MPGEAAANGDYLLPTVFHSVQSDESRHISNGYSIILMALADERNRELLERDLRYAWWNNHAVVDAAIGTFIEYGTKDRRKDRESYAEAWRRWIYDDYYRSYLMPLEKYGLTIPHDLIEESWNRIWNKGYIHEVAQFFATGWPFNYWRIDAMDDTDFEWFEHKYPGWYDKYGKWWERYARPVEEERPRADPLRRRHRLRVSAPLLELHGAVPDPRGHGGRRGRRPGPHVLLGDLPLDRRGRLPARVQGPPDAVDGQAHRQARVGDDVPRLRPRRVHPGSRLRPRRRRDAHPAAASGSRSEEDVDAGRDEGAHRSRAPTSSSTRCRPRSARPTSPSTSAAVPPAASPRRRRPRPRLSSNERRPAWTRPVASSASRGATLMGETYTRPARAGRHRVRGRRGRDGPARRLPPGPDADARLQGGSVRGLQVVPARRRGRSRQVLDVRAQRLREGGGLDAAVPRPRRCPTSRSS